MGACVPCLAVNSREAVEMGGGSDHLLGAVVLGFFLTVAVVVAIVFDFGFADAVVSVVAVAVTPTSSVAATPADVAPWAWEIHARLVFSSSASSLATLSLKVAFICSYI